MTNPSQRYEVIERLDAGGMAEVFRGRAVSFEGFEKAIAIKRVLPHLAKNQKFVNMFLDEAKLSLFLDHANIVSVFDLGRAGDTYFIVMEFVVGRNLKQLIEWYRARDEHIPTEIAAYITIEVCKGLEYAHRKIDPSGNPLNIVHRDVSPPNVLLSKEGEVKLTDFGLAKAQSQIELTDPGVVKGKFGYLSPEAAAGETVDARTDIFAAGIVLWELLAGRRLFQGKNDLETLQLVRKAEIPRIRDFQAGVPRELEDIARKALERVPDRRFKTAREMGTAISRFLARHGLAVTAYDMASTVERVIEDADPKTEDSAQKRIMSTVIQDEINKLIRIDGADASAAQQVGGAFEDPRTWGDIGFDVEPAAVPEASPRPLRGSGSSYAARGSTQSSVVATTTRVAAPPPTPRSVPNTPPAGMPPTPSSRVSRLPGGDDASGVQRSPGIQDASGLRRRTPRNVPVVNPAAVAESAAKQRAQRMTLLMLLLAVLATAYIIYLMQ